MSEVIHLKIFDICALDVKSSQVNQNLLDAYKNSVQNIKHLYYVLDDWLIRLEKNLSWNYFFMFVHSAL